MAYGCMCICICYLDALHVARIKVQTLGSKLQQFLYFLILIPFKTLGFLLRFSFWFLCYVREVFFPGGISIVKLDQFWSYKLWRIPQMEISSTTKKSSGWLMIWETHPFQKYVVSSVPNMPKVLTLSLKIRSPETVRTEGSNNNNGVCFSKNLSYLLH